MDILIQLALVLVLVILNGFFVGSEFALVSVRRTRIEQLVEEGHSGARDVRRALDHLDYYIAATQLGVTLASLALGWIGEPVVERVVEPLLAEIPIGDAAFRHSIVGTVSVVIAFVIITSLHIILGELAPKSLALQRSENIALFVARPLGLFLAAFRPFIVVLRWGGEQVVRACGIQPASGHRSAYTVEELRLVVSASHEAGEVPQVSQELVDAAFSFPELDAGQVMVPRTAMVAVSADAPLREVIDLAVRSGHGRIPVYVETLDNIIGVIYLKSLMRVLATAFRQGDVQAALGRLTAREAMREALVVPETLPIDRVMAQMRGSRLHTAIVIDEYGGTAGLVTLEDLLERVVGDMRDEFEPAEPGVQESDEGDIVDGRYLLVDFARRYDIDLERLDIEQDTVGGYVFSRLGRKPEVGDQVQLGPYTLRVERMQGLQITSVRVLGRAEVAVEGG